MQHDERAAHAVIERALFEIKKVIVGQEQVLERLLVAVLARGHILLEGVPGLAKTLAVKTVANVLGGDFARIQFTPDLVPADVIGSRVWHPDTGAFGIDRGPIFANFVLADEINRAPAKVQSALLEVMEERHVTIAGETLKVPDPFLVLATQNPIESEGVYPLPEAQSDRFLLKVTVGYPTPHQEYEIVNRVSVAPPVVDTILDAGEIAGLQHATDQIYVDPAVTHYAVSLTAATRPSNESPIGDLSRAVSFGGSPRASLGLIRGARALAVLRGREYAMPQDVADLAYDVLRHRIVLDYQAIVDGVVPEHVIQKALQVVQMPTINTSHLTPRSMGVGARQASQRALGSDDQPPPTNHKPSAGRGDDAEASA